jgi:hypothetical protein
MTDADDWDDFDSQPERTEPDFEAEAYWQHCEEAHFGESCTCPPPDPDAAWELPEGETYDTEAPF